MRRYEVDLYVYKDMERSSRYIFVKEYHIFKKVHSLKKRPSKKKKKEGVLNSVSTRRGKIY